MPRLKNAKRSLESDDDEPGSAKKKAGEDEIRRRQISNGSTPRPRPANSNEPDGSTQGLPFDY
jgi:hypothetical protein